MHFLPSWLLALAVMLHLVFSCFQYFLVKLYFKVVNFNATVCLLQLLPKKSWQSAKRSIHLCRREFLSNAWRHNHSMIRHQGRFCSARIPDYGYLRNGPCLAFPRFLQNRASAALTADLWGMCACFTVQQMLDCSNFLTLSLSFFALLKNAHKVKAWLSFKAAGLRHNWLKTSVVNFIRTSNIFKLRLGTSATFLLKSKGFIKTWSLQVKSLQSAYWSQNVISKVFACRSPTGSNSPFRKILRCARILVNVHKDHSTGHPQIYKEN